MANTIASMKSAKPIPCSPSTAAVTTQSRPRILSTSILHSLLRDRRQSERENEMKRVSARNPLYRDHSALTTLPAAGYLTPTAPTSSLKALCVASLAANISSYTDPDVFPSHLFAAALSMLPPDLVSLLSQHVAAELTCNAFIQAISLCSEVKHLSIFGPEVTDAGLLHLHPLLTSCDVDDWTAAGESPVHGFPDLETLELVSCTSLSLAAIVKTLHALRLTLKRVSLCGTIVKPVGSDELYGLIQALTNSPSLRGLDLTLNKIPNTLRLALQNLDDQIEIRL